MKFDSLTDEEQNKINVLKYQKDLLNKINSDLNTIEKDSETLIDESENILKELGINLDEIKNNSMNSFDNETKNIKEKKYKQSWEELVKISEEAVGNKNTFSDILSYEEIKYVEDKLNKWNMEFYNIYKFDEIDWIICGVAGLLAAAVDIFLIKAPKGGINGEKGGNLSNWIDEKMRNLFTSDEIKKLEKNNWVPYDPANSSKLTKKVEGLSSYFHRYHSLGHDPIIGFIIGVKDIINGTFSAIDINGKLIIQKVSNTETVGMNLFDSIGRVFGHMKSDVSTPMGLPAPLTPLLSFLQFGKVGEDGETISDIGRSMYAQGYNFNHFISMSICPLIIEVLVRFSYFSKKRYEGYSFKESLPLDSSQKLKTMLFTSHLIATSINAGKVAVQKNPLSLNYTQWLAMFRYLLPQLKWVLYEKEKKRSEMVENNLSEEWETVNKELEELLRRV